MKLCKYYYEIKLHYPAALCRSDFAFHFKPSVCNFTRFYRFVLYYFMFRPNCCEEGICWSPVLLFCFPFFVNNSNWSRLCGLSCCYHARVSFTCNMGWVTLESHLRVHIYVYSVSTYLCYYGFIGVCWFSFGSVCSCSECFRSSGSLLLGRRPSRLFVVGLSVVASVDT